MSAVSRRALGLARIAAVQAEMVKLAEWKLTAARRRREGLDEERRLLVALVACETPLGLGLARAAVRTAAGLDGHIAAVIAEIETLEGDLRSLRCRDKAVTNLSDAARTAARRADEATALGTTMEAWLARASLP